MFTKEQAFPGVTMERHVWSDVYTGKADALISAGLITADQLPGAPGNPKWCITFRNGERVRRGDPRSRVTASTFLQVKRIGAKFSVERLVGPDERARRKIEWDREREAERAKPAERAPQTMQAARINFLRVVGMLRSYMGAHVPGGDPSRQSEDFGLDEESLEEITDLINQVHNAIIDARMIPLREALKVDGIKAARSDAAFQAFLAAQCLSGDAA